jgi:diguanylate cyclase (GGDEF)-like protein
MNRILLAGLPDEAAVALREALEDAEPIVAEDLDAAVLELQGGSFGVIVVDQRLPGGSGEELVRLLRARGSAEATPVVFCLDRGSEGGLARRMVDELNVDQLLYHPLDPAELTRHVGGVLHGSKPSPRASAEVATRLQAGVAELWERFRGTILGRVDAVESAVVKLLEGDLDPETRRAAEREAHKLAGSVGSFGFLDGSRLAREAEEILAAERDLGPPDILRLADLVTALRQALERDDRRREEDDAPASDPAGASGAVRPAVLVVDADPGTGASLGAALADRGFRPLIATSFAEARELLSRESLEAAVIDPGIDEAIGGGRLMLRALGEADPPVPTLVVSTGAGVGDRVEAASLGARAFLQKPITPARLAEEVEQALARARPVRARILAVDDDPQLLAILEELLGAADLEVVTLGDPLGFWERFEEVRPDLTILDLDMPRLNGIELCRAIRRDPRWEGHPVLVLTAHKAPEMVHRVFSAGADDFVAKPVVGPELVTRIRNRLERSQLFRAMAETDYVTGLPNRRKALSLAEQLRRLAIRHRQPLCLALLDIDGFREVNARHGHPAGDRVLTRLAERLVGAFRGEDVVGRWSDEEFVLGMYGMSRSHGEMRLRQTLEAFSRERFTGRDGESFHVSFSGGVAEAPLDGEDLDTLSAAAEAALARARTRGPARICGTVDDDRVAHGVDVVLVEDDETLAALLQHALRTRGYRSHWIRGGHEALEQLSGSQAPVQGRLLLLDVDLPGIDGLSLLRRLARDGVTRTSRVIMLTARSGETEVVEALQLGAIDHVAKPFSVPVLMERVRRILEG